MTHIDEVRLPLPSGALLCFEAAKGPRSPGVGYVRIIDFGGEELTYWDSAEWARDPKVVMGAILGSLTAEFGPDAEPGRLEVESS